MCRKIGTPDLPALYHVNQGIPYKEEQSLACIQYKGLCYCQQGAGVGCIGVVGLRE